MLRGLRRDRVMVRLDSSLIVYVADPDGFIEDYLGKNRKCFRFVILSRWIFESGNGIVFSMFRDEEVRERLSCSFLNGNVCSRLRNICRWYPFQWQSFAKDLVTQWKTQFVEDYLTTKAPLFGSLFSCEINCSRKNYAQHEWSV